jgi:hypothetical protein
MDMILEVPQINEWLYCYKDIDSDKNLLFQKGKRYQVTNRIQGDYWNSTQSRIIINDIMMFSLVKGSVNFFGDSFMSLEDWREKQLKELI